MNNSWRSSPIAILFCNLQLLVTLFGATSFALPTDSSGAARLLYRDDNNDADLGNDDANAMVPSSSDSNSYSMSALSGEPVTVQLGAGFIIGCVLGVVGYVLVRLAIRMIRGGMEVSSERRRWDGRRRRESALSARSENRPDLFQI